MTTPLRLKKSTNGRPVISRLLSLVEQVAPAWLEEQAFARWCRPPKPASPRAPNVAGARAFAWDLGDEALATWEWNVGGPRGTALLVHGWGGTAAQMKAFVRPLVAAGYHVLAVDLPAHGHNPGTFATIPSLARALLAIDARARPVLVVAHSVGAAATTWALTRGLRAERVVLLASPVSLHTFIETFAGAVGLSPRMASRLQVRTERHVGFPLTELDLLRHAPTLGKTRALIVHDVDDAVVPHASGRALARAWPGARFITTQGLGHDRIRRAPEVLEAVLEFIGAAASRPAPREPGVDAESAALTAGA